MKMSHPADPTLSREPLPTPPKIPSNLTTKLTTPLTTLATPNPQAHHPIPELILLHLHTFLTPLIHLSDLAPFEHLHPANHTTTPISQCTTCPTHTITNAVVIPYGLAQLGSRGSRVDPDARRAYYEHPFFAPTMLRFEVFVAIVTSTLSPLTLSPHTSKPTREIERFRQFERVLRRTADSLLFQILERGYFDVRVRRGLASEDGSFC